MSETKVFSPATFVLCGMPLLTVLDGTVVALALPRIQARLGMSDAQGTWVVAAYVLAFGGLMLLGGRLGDTFGRRRMFLLGIGGFTVTSLLCGLAHDEYFLIVARALQGCFAAVAAPTAMALVATTFAPGKARNQAFALYAAMTGVGSIGGLVVGGFLAQASWRLVFLINVPIGFLVFIGAVKFLRESQGERLPLDVKGAIVTTIGATAFVLAMIEGPAGWSRPLVVVALVVALICLVAFVVVERTAVHPIVPFSLFRNPSRTAAIIAILFAGAMIMCMAIYVAKFLQDIQGYSPITSGLAVVPFAPSLGLAAAIASRASLRYQPRWLVIIGGISMFAGFLYAAWTFSLDNPHYFPDMLIPMLLIGFGVGFAVIPLTLSVVAGVKPTEIGPLTAVAQVAQDLGGVIGLAVIGAMATSKTLSKGGVIETPSAMNAAQLSALGDGYSWAMVVCAGVAILAGIAVLFMRFTAAEVAEAQVAQKDAN